MSTENAMTQDEIREAIAIFDAVLTDPEGAAATIAAIPAERLERIPEWLQSDEARQALKL